MAYAVNFTFGYFQLCYNIGETAFKVEMSILDMWVLALIGLYSMAVIEYDSARVSPFHTPVIFQIFCLV